MGEYLGALFQESVAAAGQKPGWGVERDVQEMACRLCGIAFGGGFCPGISETI
jgi:hypothetical protein